MTIRSNPPPVPNLLLLCSDCRVTMALRYPTLSAKFSVSQVPGAMCAAYISVNALSALERLDMPLILRAMHVVSYLHMMCHSPGMVTPAWSLRRAAREIAHWYDHSDV